MRILFINPATTLYTRSVSVPLGLLSIATFLKSKGHTVKIYDRAVDSTSLRSVIQEFRPQIAGISVLSYKLIGDMLSVAKELKELGIPVIVGGMLPSVLCEQTVRYDFIDAVSVGEGEQTWLEIADSYDRGDFQLSEIKGLVMKQPDGELLHTGDREFLDLSLLPAIDWSLVDVSAYFQASYGCDKMIYLHSAKGCPFSCTFCYNEKFHKCTYRKKPLEILLEEIRQLVTRYGVNGIYFADEMWGRSKSEMRETCRQLKNTELDFVWGCQTRIGIFDDEDFAYMHECGCRWIFFGVESGSEKMLKLVNKKIAYDKIQPTVSSCVRAGIACICSFIAGFPDETPQDLYETVSLIKKLDTKLINFNYLVAEPGTRLYEELIKKGKCKEITDIGQYVGTNPLDRLENNYSLIPDKELKVVRAYFLWHSFSAKNVPGVRKHSFAKNTISNAVSCIKKGHIGAFVSSVFSAAWEFAGIVFYLSFFPSIRKKYNLK